MPSVTPTETAPKRSPGRGNTPRLGWPVGSLAVIGLGILLFQVSSPDAQNVTYAGVFGGTDFVDLRLDGQDSVVGVFGGTFAPGDSVSGDVDVSRTTEVFQEPYDLDIDLSYTLTMGGNHPEHGPHSSFPQLLLFTQMEYGSEDLLQDPGRNLTREIDANPIVGNGDGFVSMSEFQAGINDLPPPGPSGVPTPYNITLKLIEHAGPEVMGTGVVVTWTFYLAAVQESDLN